MNKVLKQARLVRHEVKGLCCLQVWEIDEETVEKLVEVDSLLDYLKFVDSREEDVQIMDEGLFL